jgi:hypothetical protein
VAKKPIVKRPRKPAVKRIKKPTVKRPTITKPPAKPEPTWRELYKDVHLTAACDLDASEEGEDAVRYELAYTPTAAHGRPQRTSLDAETDGDAKFEAANLLGEGCTPEDLEIEYD